MQWDIFLVVFIIPQEAPESQSTWKCDFIGNIRKPESIAKSILELSNFSLPKQLLNERLFAGARLQTVIGEVFWLQRWFIN